MNTFPYLQPLNQSVKRLTAYIDLDAKRPYGKRRPLTFTAEHPNVVTSRISPTDQEWHLPIFDVDMPSLDSHMGWYLGANFKQWFTTTSRSGNNHVYTVANRTETSDWAVSWNDYRKSLEYCAVRRWIDPVWADLSVMDGCGILRLPSTVPYGCGCMWCGKDNFTTIEDLEAHEALCA